MTLEDKNSPNLEQYPKAKAEFEQWYKKCPWGCSPTYVLFCSLDLDFQSGVFLAFLREKGVIAWACPVSGLVNNKRRWSWCILNEAVGKDFDDPNTALIAAIEAGFAKLEAAECG